MFPFRAAGGTWTHTLLNFGLPPQGSESAKFLHGRIFLSYPFRSPLVSVIQRLECLPSMLRVGFTPTTLRFYYWTTAAFETVFLSVQHVNERFRFTLLIYKNYAKQTNLCIKFLLRRLGLNQWPVGYESTALPLSYYALCRGTPIRTETLQIWSLGCYHYTMPLYLLSSCHFVCYRCW